MTEPVGYRGYIGSRPVFGARAPQHVQNLVIRDYAQRHGLRYLLSAVEYTMPGCFLMLKDVLAELPRTQGIICYSLFMLPRNPIRRMDIYRMVLQSGGELHAAVEDLSLRRAEDIEFLEDVWLVQNFLAGFEHSKRVAGVIHG